MREPESLCCTGERECADQVREKEREHVLLGEREHVLLGERASVVQVRERICCSGEREHVLFR